jgi:hypothetical protein
LRQGDIAEIDADRFAWRHLSGEIDGDGAGTTPAVNEAHPAPQMWLEKCGCRAGAAGKHSAAPFVVCLIGPLGTRSPVGHAPLLWLPGG